MVANDTSSGAATAHGHISILNKKGKPLPETAIKELKEFKSELTIKGEASEEVYRAAIHRWNEASITESSIVAFCETEDDIGFCLRFVQKWDMDMAIAGGRHSYFGASSTTGFVIDNRKMRKVVIDKDAMTVTAQGGCKAKDLEDPLAEMGLAVVMGIVSDTGIGGLTLGGGTGPLTGKHGHIVDNLLSAKLVLANGTLVHASEDSNPDLFWAIRGGGSNFGVVTEFKYRVHEQGPIYLGRLVFNPDRLHDIIDLAPWMLKTAEDCKGKLTIYYSFAKAAGMTAVHPTVVIIYDGPAEEANALLAPVIELGPAVNVGKVQPFVSLTNPSPGPRSHQRYTVGNFVMPLPLDTSIYKSLAADFSTFMEKYGSAVGPSRFMIEFRHSSPKPVSSTALGGRVRGCVSFVEAEYDITISDTIVRNEVSAMVQKCRDQITKRYANNTTDVLVHANIADGTDKLERFFGENLPRLRELKRKYDPNFVFNKWYPIDPNVS